jgi:penicillin amidase
MRKTIGVLALAVGSALAAGGPQPQSAIKDATASASLASRAKSAVAKISGTFQLPGLRGEVRVQRDHWGVAHIFAQNQHDLFFAQGFVVSQDRLFQMELWKRSGQGRLAEVLGSSAVERDISARLLRYRGNMEAEYRSYAPDTREILEAFTSGINAYIEEIQKPGGSGLPIEFQISRFKPEPWTPEDCLNRMAAYSMTGNGTSELQHAQLVALLGTEKASELFEFDPAVKLDPAPGADFSGLSPKLLDNLVGSDSRIQFPASAIAALEGSNNWTVSGALTATGKPLLANDPHRVIAEPSLRYVVHLVAPGWNVIGAGEPGLPGVAAGHNEKIAWGFTIFGLDQQDLYLAQLNPANPDQYQTERGWQSMEVKSETIRVRGASPVTAKLRFTRHGPVMWNDGKRALILRWVGDEPGTAGYLGSLALDRAGNWQEFEEAMARWKVPSENIVYADREGNIGEHSTGLAPIRKNWTGLLPVPENGAYEWSGFVPNADLPHSYNPASGFVATANHKMIPENYKYEVGFQWGSPERFLRISEVLSGAKQSGHKLRVEDMESLQNDVVSLPARELQALLKGAANGTAGDGAKLLVDWDCTLTTDSSAATLYEFWVKELHEALTNKLIPEQARKGVGLSLPQMVKELSHPRIAIFGIDAEAARDALLLQTLHDAEQKLSAKLGPDAQSWSWGQLHRVFFRHPLGVTAELQALFDLGPVARPGENYTVNATAFAGSGYDQLAGASYREIFDLSDWDNAVGVNVPGESGQPGSKHYDDLLPLWTAGKYFPLLYTKAAIDHQTTDTLELKP